MDVHLEKWFRPKIDKEVLKELTKKSDLIKTEKEGSDLINFKKLILTGKKKKYLQDLFVRSLFTDHA